MQNLDEVLVDVERLVIEITEASSVKWGVSAPKTHME